MNLCIDIDGTITEPYYWLRRANEYFKTNIQPKDVTAYEIHKVLGIEEVAFRQFYNSYGKLLHKEAKIRFGVRQMINKLQQNHQIHIVSAREEKLKDITLEWLDSYQIPMDSIALLGDSNKVWKAKQLASDFFIEDSYDNAIQLSQAGFDVLLINCNYNKGPIPANVKRVKNWYQIAQIIRESTEQGSQRQVQYKLA